MSKADSLRFRDIRAAFRLIGECRDLGNEPGLWHRRMLEGLAILFGIVQAAAAEVSWERPGRHFQPVAAYTVAAEAAGLDAFRAYHRDEAWESDPIVRAIEKRPGKLITRTRRQLVTDLSWYRSVTFERYYRPGGVDHALVSAFQVSDDATSIFTLHRPLGERNFSARETRLLNFFHAELGRLIGGPLVAATDSGVDQLSPRLRATLACLLEGDSEKQAAARLGLSRSTVHQYITALYRHFSSPEPRPAPRSCQHARSPLDLRSTVLSAEEWRPRTGEPRDRQTTARALHEDEAAQPPRSTALSRHFAGQSRAQLLAQLIKRVRHGGIATPLGAAIRRRGESSGSGGYSSV